MDYKIKSVVCFINTGILKKCVTEHQIIGIQRMEGDMY